MDRTIPDKIPVGVVVERRPAANRWRDYAWRAVEAMVDGPDSGWRLLARDHGVGRYYAGGLTIELFRKETEGYKRNLSMDVPRIWVVLRSAWHDGETVMAPFHVTVCPYEAESYELSGDDQVEAVPMPPEVGAVVQAFVERFHVDEPFLKRKLKPKVEDHGRR